MIILPVGWTWLGRIADLIGTLGYVLAVLFGIRTKNVRKQYKSRIFRIKVKNRFDIYFEEIKEHLNGFDLKEKEIHVSLNKISAELRMLIKNKGKMDDTTCKSLFGIIDNYSYKMNRSDGLIQIYSGLAKVIAELDLQEESEED